ncbi:probable inactive receptor kinase At5g67200 isoform X2 [Punica granatum]|uniref:Probable inactive receptor kinase At5g67200 isoform X2 n=1 Tax=Punica granatum TaxID=22663 RepID=A0A6P8D1P9_PUNGR|nr:probable inactive receptor kinase At5g67200 isoform X2 [Punica granatum]
MHVIASLVFFIFPLSAAAGAVSSPDLSALIPNDAASLLAFKTSADLDNALHYSLTERFDFCQWRGVKCAQGRVVRFVLQGSGLRGSFAPATLSRLDQLRVLSLQNNSLSGPVPDLSPLSSLRSLFLGHNHFSGPFPASIVSLHRLRVLDLSFNNFSGLLPPSLTVLDRLDTLRLEWNRFNGSLPPLNQTLLGSFNVSGNNLTGPVPATETLSRFGSSSFSYNPGLCGETVNRACRSKEPFFGGPPAGGASVPAPLGQSAESQGAAAIGLSPPLVSPKKHKKTGIVLGFTVGVLVLISAVAIVFALIKARRNKSGDESRSIGPKEPSAIAPDVAEPPPFSAVPIQKPVMEAKGNVEEAPPRVQRRSGCLVFSAGEPELYTLEQLMRGSAELLGRGSMGTTYKAVLDNQLIVTVKRLDANKTASTGEEAFKQHMEAVGGLRHPNMVPVRAYFQAKGERLVIFDYMPNGSLYNLIHGCVGLTSRVALHEELGWWDACYRMRPVVGGPFTCQYWSICGLRSCDNCCSFFVPNRISACSNGNAILAASLKKASSLCPAW